MPCPLCNDVLETARDGFGHFLRKHQARKISWFCIKCDSLKPGLHSATCHAAKCVANKRVRPTTNHMFVCEICSSSFKTRRGLSLHTKKHGNAGNKLKTKKLGDSHAGHYKGLFSPLPPPTNKRATQPSMTLKRHLEHQFNDVNVPPGCIHPLQSSPALVNRTLSLYVKKMKSSNKIRVSRPWKPRRLCVTKGNRRDKYRTIQSLYMNDTAAAASLILDRKEATTCNIHIRKIEEAYIALWEKDDMYKDLGVFGTLPEANNEPLLMAITPSEVLAAIRGSRGKSAPGPDGIRKAHLLLWDKDGEKLAHLFNAILYNGKLPRLLKRSRSTLVPKSSDPMELSRVENWRPISLSSTILRLLSKILCDRLSEACPAHSSQKGFTRGEGCGTNLMLLDGVVRRAVLSHQHIREVLELRKVDASICDLVSNSYKHTSSRVLTHCGRTRSITLKVGVKQGDPMSPLLFNLCLDPLLTFLDQRGSGFTLSGQSITTLAYADDLVLLSGSWTGMARNLLILEKFLDHTGLEVKIKKCGGFYLNASKQSVVVNDCAEWTIRAAPVPMVDETQAYKYLGVQVNPKRGILPSNPVKEITPILRKISRAPLKPSQKVKMLVTYGIPRVTYGADMSLAGILNLRKADLEIRNNVKSWLHLSQSTADGLFYSAKVNGGLGLPKLEKIIPISQVKRWCRMFQSGDVKCRALAPSLLPKSEIEKRWVAATGGGGGGGRWRDLEYERWCGLKCQGRGLATFAKDPVSNSWLGDHWGLHESDYILALQLRSSTVGTLTTLSRWRRGNTNCRACGRGWEGIIHVVSQCKFFKKNRMANHNIICGMLAVIGRTLGWVVKQEKRITCPHLGTAVPDLIMLKNGKGLVVDVAVCFEMKPATLRRRAEAKVSKYGKFAPVVCNMFGLANVKTFGFPLGARGKWYEGNSSVLREMGLPRSRIKAMAKLFSVTAIRGSTKILKIFKKHTRTA
uniref:Reverse transcriptase domain-containing protein n=1 Tax=Poecilia latipinna TaxID=48699 RepID=A0A3B3U912_9TELE